MAEQQELNLKFDGKEEILELAKQVAASRGESLNSFCIRAIAEACGIRSQPHLSLGVDVEWLLEKTLAPVRTRLEEVEAEIGK